MDEAVFKAVSVLLKAGYKTAAAELQDSLEKFRVESFQNLPPALPEVFTLKQLREAWAEYTGLDAGYSDTFTRRSEHLVKPTGKKTEGLRGKPARLFTAA